MKEYEISNERLKRIIVAALAEGNERNIKSILKLYISKGNSFSEFGNSPETLSDLIAFHGSMEGMKLAKKYDTALEDNKDILKQACYFYSPNGKYINCLNYMIENNIGTEDSTSVAKAIELLEERCNFLEYMGESTLEIEKIISRLSKAEEK